VIALYDLCCFGERMWETMVLQPWEQFSAACYWNWTLENVPSQMLVCDIWFEGHSFMELLPVCPSSCWMEMLQAMLEPLK
jgi:hypothetical protein